MKHRYIDLLQSELQQLSSKVENLKVNNKVPFSFFKESFTRTQEITRLLHELEFLQIEDMRGQMEKLVQYLSDAENSAKETAEESHKEAQEEAEKESVVVVNKVDASKPNDLEIAEADQEGQADTDITEPISEPKDIVVEKKQDFSTVAEQSVESGEDEPEGENESETEEYNKEESITKENEIEENENNTVSATPVVKSKEEYPQHRPLLLNDKAEAVLANIAPKNRSLNDVHPVGHTIQDVKRSISLNDRFLFQRELFNNNRDAMNAMLTKLQSFASFDLVESYLEKNTTWDFRDDTVDKFMQMLKDSFR